jgi:hypothetical protein
MKDYVLKNKPEPAANETVWAFDLGKGSIGDFPSPRWGEGGRSPDEVNPIPQFLHKASLLIPADFALPRGRECCACLRRPRSRVLPRGETKTAAGSRSAAVPGCGCGWRLAASSIAGRDARPTRRRDACATRFTQNHAAPTALGRIELKIPIKFSTRFGNGRINQPDENEDSKLTLEYLRRKLALYGEN